MDLNKDPDYQCSLCNDTFVDCSQLAHHLSSFHDTHQSESSSKLICPLCIEPSDTFPALRNHIKTVHKQEQSNVVLTFSTMSEFMGWKKKLLQRNYNYDMNSTPKKYSPEKVKYLYVCNSSRLQKISSPCESGGKSAPITQAVTCPSTIEAILDEMTGFMQVVYWYNHVGHDGKTAASTSFTSETGVHEKVVSLSSQGSAADSHNTPSNSLQGNAADSHNTSSLSSKENSTYSYSTPSFQRENTTDNSQQKPLTGANAESLLISENIQSIQVKLRLLSHLAHVPVFTRSYPDKKHLEAINSCLDSSLGYFHECLSDRDFCEIVGNFSEFSKRSLVANMVPANAIGQRRKSASQKMNKFSKVGIKSMAIQKRRRQ